MPLGRVLQYWHCFLRQSGAQTIDLAAEAASIDDDLDALDNLEAQLDLNQEPGTQNQEPRSA